MRHHIDVNRFWPNFPTGIYETKKKLGSVLRQSLLHNGARSVICSAYLNCGTIQLSCSAKIACNTGKKLSGSSCQG